MDEVDVVVLGGGAAGLSAAVTLARSRRRVVVVDFGDPRNTPADGVHNLLGNEGVAPRDLVAKGRAELEGYGGEVVEDAVVDARPTGTDERPAFVVRTARGRELRARRLVLATGVRDELPDVPGLAERWGHDVLHCPYCHGWEVRDRRVVVLTTGPWSAHHALLFSQLTADVTLVLHEGPQPPDDEAPLLEARGVRVLEGVATGVAVEGERLVGLRLASGEVLDADAVVVGTRLHARLDGLEGLGLPVAEIRTDGHLLATHVESDPGGRTQVPGIWAAGNVTTPMAQVVHSAAGGVTAGAQINSDLVTEDARHP